MAGATGGRDAVEDELRQLREEIQSRQFP